MGSVKLSVATHETTRATLRELVRQMNSFYSRKFAAR